MVKFGVLQHGYRNRVREILDAALKFHNDEESSSRVLMHYNVPGDSRVICVKRFIESQGALFHVRQNAELSRNE